MNKFYVLGAELITSDISSFEELGNFLTNKFELKQSSIFKACNDDILKIYFGGRYAKKIDRSVQLSLYTVDSLLKRISLSDIERDDIGIFLGNNYAGWSYVEGQMLGLYKGDVDAINPYVATAWFPAAGQGEISIRNKLFGMSKTFSCDQLSSAVALDFSLDILSTNQLKYVITGGYESLISDIIISSLKIDHRISTEYPASEASSVLILTNQAEEKNRALATIDYMGRSSDLNTLLKNMMCKINIEEISYWLLPPLNLSDEKNNLFIRNEINTLTNFCGKSKIMGVPTYFMGEVCAASFALQVVVAVWMLENQRIPFGYLADYNLASKIANDKPLTSILVIGRDYFGEQYMSFILNKII